MSNDPKVVVIGAGSASFGLETLAGIMNQEILTKNATLYLVDIDKEKLKLIGKLAEIIKKEWKSNIEIIITTDRKEALPDANFVVLSVAVDREKTWLKDHEIGLKYGLYHYAENGGPGSFSHTARGMNFIYPILEDIHDLAPEAWLINYTNPVPRIGYAAQIANVKYIGLCHQIWHAYAVVGRYLARELNITDEKLLNFEYQWKNESFSLMYQLVVMAFNEYDIKAAGLNHFIWLMDIRRRSNWQDMYPLIKQEAKNVNPNFEPLTQHLFKIFGILPGAGDTHLSEYLPYTRTKENWKKYNIAMYDFEWGKRKRQEMWTRIREIVSGNRPMDINTNPSERADWIMTEIYQNENSYEQSVNIVNNGTITNLPDDAIVEVPALVNSYGVSGMKIGKLPEAIAALCQREISIAKLITKGSITGDRETIIRAFAIDTMVNDLDLAEKLVDEYLIAHKQYLPQFYNKQ